MRASSACTPVDTVEMGCRAAQHVHLESLHVQLQEDALAIAHHVSPRSSRAARPARSRCRCRPSRARSPGGARPSRGASCSSEFAATWMSAVAVLVAEREAPRAPRGVAGRCAAPAPRMPRRGARRRRSGGRSPRARSRCAYWPGVGADVEDDVDLLAPQELGAPHVLVVRGRAGVVRDAARSRARRSPCWIASLRRARTVTRPDLRSRTPYDAPPCGS